MKEFIHASNSSVLLCSLGRSWAVVPEAFHRFGPNEDHPSFSAVHVLTTEDPEILSQGVRQVQDYFGSRFAHIPLTFTSVAGFSDLTSEADHSRFEEVLYRWILEVSPEPSSRWICLAGGFKTMSAAMQRAASLLGAAGVFHVLADPRVNSSSLVDEAVKKGEIRFVNLGAETGWPQFRNIATGDYPLVTLKDYGPVRSVVPAESPATGFCQHIQEVTRRIHGIARSWERLAELPFAELAVWPEADLKWLGAPLDPRADADWVRALPKIELHSHLGGFATHGPDLINVREAASDPGELPAIQPLEVPVGWPRPRQPCLLKPYLALGGNNGSSLLKDPGCLKRQCTLLYERLVQDKVLYAEIRCSPNNYAVPEKGRTAWDVLQEIREVFQDCMSSSASAGLLCHINLIVIATRKTDGDRSDISRHLALAITAADQWRNSEGCRVVGVDLAGFETRENRAELFQIDFEPVHRVGLAVTVHAGENDDAEGIWQAVFKLHARRLGHALHLQQARDLYRVVVDRRIGIEMCPFANMQIKGFGPVTSSTQRGYPLLDYLRNGVMVTANTDNIGISAANLSDNLLLLAELSPGIRRIDILKLQRNALDVAFLSDGARRNHLDQLATAIPRP